MTIRQRNLLRILSLKYLENDNITFIESRDLANTDHFLNYQKVYESLGGNGNAPELSIKGYLFENFKFSLELDDQLDFNRYRLKTFRSDIYHSFPGIKVEKYRIYCNKYEKECLKVGSPKGIWTNKKAETIFGQSEHAGDFGLNGSAGWKLLALENYLKDLYSRYKKIRLLRISVWDEILINKQLVKVGDLLTNPDQKASEHILNHIERRTVTLFSE